MNTRAAELWKLLKAAIAGGAATLADVAVLTLLVAGLGLTPAAANVPALVVGGVVNFFGNRHFAFRARSGDVVQQAVRYGVVEIVALVLNGVLYAAAIHAAGARASHLFWAIRLATSHVVFLGWSYPLWRHVFRVPQPA